MKQVDSDGDTIAASSGDESGPDRRSRAKDERDEGDDASDLTSLPNQSDDEDMEGGAGLGQGAGGGIFSNGSYLRSSGVASNGTGPQASASNGQRGTVHAQVGQWAKHGAIATNDYLSAIAGPAIPAFSTSLHGPTSHGQQQLQQYHNCDGLSKGAGSGKAPLGHGALTHNAGSELGPTSAPDWAKNDGGGAWQVGQHGHPAAQA